MSFAVIVFPGSNCDHDAFYALKKILGVPVDLVWHQNTSLDKYDGIIIPGGFSYGDYLRTGSIACFSPIMQAIIKCADEGKFIFGICNGFQILIEAGLLPGALIINKNIRFVSQSVKIEVENTNSIFTRNLNKGELLKMPIAHKQGNYMANDEILKMLKSEERILFRYSEETGNLNGSVERIAGIINNKRNVLGMMPHPERATESLLGSNDGLKIFKSILGFSV